jgi:hypothetical protein
MKVNRIGDNSLYKDSIIKSNVEDDVDLEQIIEVVCNNEHEPYAYLILIKVLKKINPGQD